MVREHSKADIIYFSGPETKEHEKKATKNEKSIISDTYRYIYAIYRYIYIFVRINCSCKNKKLKKQRKKKDTQRVKKHNVSNAGPGQAVSLKRIILNWFAD